MSSIANRFSDGFTSWDDFWGPSQKQKQMYKHTERRAAFYDAAQAVLITLIGQDSSETVENDDDAQSWLNRQIMIRFSGVVAGKLQFGKWYWSSAVDDNTAVIQMLFAAGLDLNEVTKYRSNMVKTTQDFVYQPEVWAMIEEAAAILLEEKSLADDRLQSICGF